MKKSNETLSISKDWITVQGELRPETESQRALLQKSWFVRSLKHYHHARQTKDSTIYSREDRRYRLNLEMERAFQTDTRPDKLSTVADHTSSDVCFPKL